MKKRKKPELRLTAEEIQQVQLVTAARATLQLRVTKPARGQRASLEEERRKAVKVEFAEQYGCYCIVLDGDEDPKKVIERAINADAMYGPDYCVRFPGRPQELLHGRSAAA